MRGVTAFVLAVLLVAVLVETRPPRDKRGIKICSARDVKFMATFVCNLHKRSVRSVDAAEFGADTPDTEGLPALGGASHLPRRPICTGPDCRKQIEGGDLPSSEPLIYIQEWLTENGYPAMMTSGYRNVPARTAENGQQRMYEENGAGRSNLLQVLEQLGVTRNGFAKRDKEIDWPVVPAMTLGDIRRNCCLRQCRVEDFYGACS